MPNKSDLNQHAAAMLEVEKWNKKYPIGVAVEVWKDDGTPFQTVTRSEAYLLGSDAPVIMVKGIAGCYLLSRCTAKPNEGTYRGELEEKYNEVGEYSSKDGWIKRIIEGDLTHAHVIQLVAERDCLEQQLKKEQEENRTLSAALQEIHNIGFDYDGFVTTLDLMNLVDELVKIADTALAGE